MDYVPMFPTGIEPLSLSCSSNETNGLSQNVDSVPNDDSALIILQICVPMTTSSTGMKADNDRYSSLNDVTAPQAFSATTATMTATMTQVLAKTTAITKVIQNKLVECFLHPANSSANNATNKSESPLLHALFGSAILTARIHTPSLLLPLCQDNSAIMTATHAQNLLLLCIQDNAAITMATHTNSKLQLIVGCSHKALTYQVD
jgi:hypothetical protein